MSRSIGDVGLSGAIIPTPDVFVLHVPLIDDDDDNDNGRSQGYSRCCT
jgi:hypothetical protein